MHELEDFGLKVVVSDPNAEPHEAQAEYGVQLQSLSNIPQADAIIAAVAHQALIALEPRQLAKITGQGAPFLDVKSAYNKEQLEQAGFLVWRL